VEESQFYDSGVLLIVRGASLVTRAMFRGFRLGPLIFWIVPARPRWTVLNVGRLKFIVGRGLSLISEAIIV